MKLLYRVLLLLLAAVVFFAVAGIVATWAPDKPVDELKARWAPPPSAFILIDGVFEDGL